LTGAAGALARFRAMASSASGEVLYLTDEEQPPNSLLSQPAATASGVEQPDSGGRIDLTGEGSREGYPTFFVSSVVWTTEAQGDAMSDSNIVAKVPSNKRAGEGDGAGEGDAGGRPSKVFLCANESSKVIDLTGKQVRTSAGTSRPPLPEAMTSSGSPWKQGDVAWTARAGVADGNCGLQVTLVERLSEGGRDGPLWHVRCVGGESPSEWQGGSGVKERRIFRISESKLSKPRPAQTAPEGGALPGLRPAASGDESQAAGTKRRLDVDVAEALAGTDNAFLRKTFDPLVEHFQASSASAPYLTPDNGLVLVLRGNAGDDLAARLQCLGQPPHGNAAIACLMPVGIQAVCTMSLLEDPATTSEQCLLKALVAYRCPNDQVGSWELCVLAATLSRGVSCLKIAFQDEVTLLKTLADRYKVNLCWTRLDLPLSDHRDRIGDLFVNAVDATETIVAAIRLYDATDGDSSDHVGSKKKKGSTKLLMDGTQRFDWSVTAQAVKWLAQGEERQQSLAMLAAYLIMMKDSHELAMMAASHKFDRMASSDSALKLLLGLVGGSEHTEAVEEMCQECPGFARVWKVCQRKAKAWYKKTTGKDGNKALMHEVTLHAPPCFAGRAMLQ